MALHNRPVRQKIEPLPKGGRVVYRGQPYRILSIRVHDDDRFTYTLEPLIPGLRTVHLVTLEMVLKELEAYARYAVQTSVPLGYSDLTVFKRQWDLRTGTVWYYLAHPNRNVAAGWFNQETMMRLDRSLDPIQDNEMGPTPRQHLFPRHGR